MREGAYPKLPNAQMMLDRFLGVSLALLSPSPCFCSRVHANQSQHTYNCSAHSQPRTAQHLSIVFTGVRQHVTNHHPATSWKARLQCLPKVPWLLQQCVPALVRTLSWALWHLNE